jgi:hypothetical protein
MTQRFSSQRFNASRRSILASASALLALAPFAAKAAASNAVAGRIAIADLVNELGQPTQRARELVGQAITLRGYAAPSSLGAAVVLALTEGSQAPCQLCGTIHDAGPAVLVKPNGTLPSSLSMLSMVDVRGKLTVGDGEVRLEDATIQVL